MGEGVVRKADLVEALQEKGFSRRKASASVDAVFDAISSALKEGQEVYLPIGSFHVEPVTRRPLRGWFLNRVRTTYKKRNKVVFRPNVQS